MAKKKQYFVWIPRILAILLALSLFNPSFQLVPNIPFLFVLIVALVSFKYELVGVVAFFILGALDLGLSLALLPMDMPIQITNLFYDLIIGGLAIASSIMFFRSFNKHKNKKK